MASGSSEANKRVPSWNGNVATWGQYETDVAWFTSSFPNDKRCQVVGRLVSALPDNSAVRTLVQQWKPSTYDLPDGAFLFLQRLRHSPLMRQPLTGASNSIQRYFTYRRYKGQTMGEYIVQEQRTFREHLDAMRRLRTEYIAKGFIEDRWTAAQWRRWHLRLHGHLNPQSVAASATSSNGRRRPPTPPPAPLAGTAPRWRRGQDRRGQDQAWFDWNRRGANTPSVVSHEGSASRADEDSDSDESDADDMFYLGLLRGHKMLLNSGLDNRERVQILTSTSNRTDYEAIVQGLRQQWEDGELRERDSNKRGQNAHALWGEAEAYALDKDAPKESPLPEAPTEPTVCGVPWGTVNALADLELRGDEEYVAMKEELNALEAQAFEANRNLAAARQAVATYRTDRGFGKVVARLGKGKGKSKGKANGKSKFPGKSKGPSPIVCWTCGGPHRQSECPDLAAGAARGPGGKGANALEDWYNDQSWDEQAWSLDTWGAMDPANEASQWLDHWGLEMDSFAAPMEATPGRILPSVPHGSGLCDTGASACAGPEVSVTRFAQALLRVAPDANLTVDSSNGCRPWFRFGNGRWQQGLFLLKASMERLGRQILIFCLPDSTSQVKNAEPVPILVGMTHLGPSGCILDCGTGHMAYASIDGDLPRNLPRGPRGHFLIDIVEYLSGVQEDVFAQGQLESQAEYVAEPVQTSLATTSRAPREKQTRFALDHNCIDIGHGFDCCPAEVLRSSPENSELSSMAIEWREAMINAIDTSEASPMFMRMLQSRQAEFRASQSAAASVATGSHGADTLRADHRGRVAESSRDATGGSDRSTIPRSLAVPRSPSGTREQHGDEPADGRGVQGEPVPSTGDVRHVWPHSGVLAKARTQWKSFSTCESMRRAVGAGRDRRRRPRLLAETGRSQVPGGGSPRQGDGARTTEGEGKGEDEAKALCPAELDERGKAAVSDAAVEQSDSEQLRRTASSERYSFEDAVRGRRDQSSLRAEGPGLDAAVSPPDAVPGRPLRRRGSARDLREAHQPGGCASCQGQVGRQEPDGRVASGGSGERRALSHDSFHPRSCVRAFEQRVRQRVLERRHPVNPEPISRSVGDVLPVSSDSLDGDPVSSETGHLAATDPQPDFPVSKSPPDSDSLDSVIPSHLASSRLDAGSVFKEIAVETLEPVLRFTREHNLHIFEIVKDVLAFQSSPPRDHLWEVCCAPNSELTNSCMHVGLSCKRIGFSTGFDLSKRATYSKLQDAGDTHRPHKILVSLPCGPWTSITNFNQGRPATWQRILAKRGKARWMQAQISNWIKQRIAMDADTEVYIEWTHGCSAWQQDPIKNLEESLIKSGKPWLQARIDGCRYGMKDRKGEHLVRKSWRIMTTDGAFHEEFKAKTCTNKSRDASTPGDHHHTLLEASEVA